MVSYGLNTIAGCFDPRLALSPGNRPEVTIRESENQTNVTGDLILDLPKVKVVNIKNPKPGKQDRDGAA